MIHPPPLRLLALLALGPCLLARTARGDATFGPSGVDGAGFQNCVAVDPFNGCVLLGADTAGIHRSPDGDVFIPSNNGIYGNALNVAAIEFARHTPGLVYVAAGNGTSGGSELYRSSDDGVTWTVASHAVIFEGGNGAYTDVGAPAEHPRPTGRLLALDDSHSFSTGAFLYAGSYASGLFRSSDDGANWDLLGLGGRHIRGIALDPSRPDVLLVATYGAGVFRLTNAHTASALPAGSTGNGAFAPLSGAPPVVEELLHLGGDQLYAASSSSGIFRGTDEGDTWLPVNAGLHVSGTKLTHWSAIDGFVNDDGSATLYISGESPYNQPDGLGAESVMKSTDSGATWTRVSLSDHTSYHVTDDSGPVWWLSKTQGSTMLDKPGYVGAQIAVDPSHRESIYVAGKSGAWRSVDAGDTWHPMVAGLQVTINRGIVTDPNTPGRVYIANTDWVVLSSADNLATLIQRRPSGSGSVGFAIALDTTTSPSGVYVATGDRDFNQESEIFYSPDPQLNNTGWVSLHFADAVPSSRSAGGGKRPYGIAFQRVGGVPVLIAAVEGGGIWRYAGQPGSGTWTQVDAVAMADERNTKLVSVLWPAGADVVYLHDRKTGLWRSLDDGLHWSRIWSGSDVNGAADGTGFLLCPPGSPGTLYVSTAAGLWRLDGADSGTEVGTDINRTALGGSTVKNWGPIALDAEGRLCVVDTSSVRKFWALPTPASGDGGPPVNIADDFYRLSATPLDPKGLAITPTGRVYLAGRGAITGQIDVVPTVTLTAPTTLTEGGPPGSVTVQRTGATTDALVVAYMLSGTATNGSDYAALSGTVTIPAGFGAVAFPITPLADDLAEGDETITLSLTAGAYLAGGSGTATITLADSAFDTWRLARFGASANDPTTGAALADPDHDGLVNLAEYALGSDPLAPSAPPAAGIELSDTTPRLTLTFTRAAPADTRITVQASSDLVNWDPGSTYSPTGDNPDTAATSESRRTGDDPVAITVRDNTPLDTSSRRFLRLLIEHL